MQSSYDLLKYRELSIWCYFTFYKNHINKILINLEYLAYTDFRPCIKWDSCHIRLRISPVVLYDVAMSSSNIVMFLCFLYLGVSAEILQAEHTDRMQITQI
jgi:hypothetical protein